MTNHESTLAGYRDRIIELDRERRERAEDIREIMVEMKAADLTKAEIAGVKLAVRRHFETEDQAALRESAEEVAAALGALADTPLGEAAVNGAARDPAWKRAAKRADAATAYLDRLAREGGYTATLTSGGETIATFGAPTAA